MPFELDNPLLSPMYRDIEQARAAQKAKQAKKEVPSFPEKPPVKQAPSQSAVDTFVRVASGAHSAEGSDSQKKIGSQAKEVKGAPAHKLTDEDMHRVLSGLSSW